MAGNEETALMETVRFGIEVEAFINGPIGRHLVERAHKEEAEALNALADAVPTDVNTIRELQNRVHRARSIDHWLAEAISEGYHAEHQLRQTEEV